MSQIITISIRASESGLEKSLRPYYQEGWRVIAKQRGSWWGKMGTTYNWRITLEKKDPPAPKATNLADELMKLVQLKESGAITQEEFEQLKKRLLE